MRENTFDIPSVKFCIGYISVPYEKIIEEFNYRKNETGIYIEAMMKDFNERW